eukprot:5868799-Pyramimonas_sp.AAC.1
MAAHSCACPPADELQRHWKRFQCLFPLAPSRPAAAAHIGHRGSSNAQWEVGREPGVVARHARRPPSRHTNHSGQVRRRRDDIN